MKLGKRLRQIESMVTEHYDHIWDCCCDHGLLGAALLARHAGDVIHFVDVVPELINQVETKLTHFYSQETSSTSAAKWQVHCMDVGELLLQPHDAKHLVIIAGVGGDLMSELVKSIYQRNLTADYDFLLCPVHHQFTVRQQLIQLDFSLRTEVLVMENQRYYEVLLVSKATSKIQPTIQAVGSLIWQSETPEQLNTASGYLNKTLSHYQRMQLNSGTDVQAIIDAYNAVIL
ncbi:MAG: SAM-dependent methyltransferase [Flavobacterium sp.]|nr:MAG: SAM-dependent methyltransferase [Flavobacterium sp.]